MPLTRRPLAGALAATLLVALHWQPERSLVVRFTSAASDQGPAASSPSIRCAERGKDGGTAASFAR